MATPPLTCQVNTVTAHTDLLFGEPLLHVRYLLCIADSTNICLVLLPVASQEDQLDQTFRTTESGSLDMVRAQSGENRIFLSQKADMQPVPLSSEHH